MGDFLLGKSRTSTVETTPFQQTFLFDPQQHQALQRQAFQNVGQLGQAFDFTDPAASANQFASGLEFAGIGGPAHVGGTAAEFTSEFPAIFEQLTESPVVERALAQFIDPQLAAQRRQEEGLIRRAAQRGIDLSSGEVKGELVRNLASGAQNQARARAQAFLGALTPAVGAASQQAGQETGLQGALANAQANIFGSHAIASGNVAASRNAQLGALGREFLDIPFRQAGLLNPTATNFPRHQVIDQGRKPGALEVAGRAFSVFG